MTIRKLLASAFSLSIYSLLLLGTSNAQCTAGTLIGDYDVVSQGMVNAGGVERSVALIVLDKFDGQGNLTAAGAQSVDGNLSSFQNTGSYTLLPDCTGSFTQTVVINGTPAVRHFDIVASEDGSAVHFIQTDPGGTRIGMLMKSGKSGDADDQAKNGSEDAVGKCSLNGAFNYDGQGMQQTASGQKPQAVQMQISFDAEGGQLVVKGTQSLDGAITRFTGTGTYALDSECTGTMTTDVSFSDGTTQTQNFNLVANADRTRFFALRTNAGTTQAASATKVVSHRP